MLAGKELRWCKVASNKITGLEELFGTPNVLPCLRVLNLERNFITSTKGLQASARQTHSSALLGAGSLFSLFVHRYTHTGGARMRAVLAEERRARRVPRKTKQKHTTRTPLVHRRSRVCKRWCSPTTHSRTARPWASCMI